jgi:hypothetical protein
MISKTARLSSIYCGLRREASNVVPIREPEPEPEEPKEEDAGDGPRKMEINSLEDGTFEAELKQA